MPTYFVRKTGSDAAAGTSAATAWLTLAKALGAAGIASGDTVWIGAGTYRETVTVAMASATVATRVVADVDGSQTGDAGPVIWTGHTTNDTTAPPTAIATLTLAGRDFLTFERVVMISTGRSGVNAPSLIDAITETSINITFQDCALISHQGSVLAQVNGAAGVVLNWTFNRCLIHHQAASVSDSAWLSIVPGAHTADWDLNFYVNNCRVFAPASGVRLEPSVKGGGGPGGVRLTNNTFFGGDPVFSVINAGTTPACSFNNNLVAGAVSCLNAEILGYITENYNRITAATARTNVTAGANTVTAATHAPLLEIGQTGFAGGALRPYLEPLGGSPLLGFGNVGGATVDLYNRPRPAGGPILNAVGALERGNSAAKETTVTQAGTAAIKITGPGYQDFQVPVNTGTVTLSVYARKNASYTGTAPQLQVRHGAGVGVADAAVTHTAAADTWEQLSLAITPTVAGIVTVRLLSNSTAAAGIAYFDTFGVA